MAESIIAQSILEERIEAQRQRIANVTGVLALAIRTAQDLQNGAVHDPDTAEDLEQALDVAHGLLHEIYVGLEPSDIVLFKPDAAMSAEGVSHGYVEVHRPPPPRPRRFRAGSHCGGDHARRHMMCRQGRRRGLPPRERAARHVLRSSQDSGRHHSERPSR